MMTPVIIRILKFTPLFIGILYLPPIVITILDEPRMIKYIAGAPAVLPLRMADDILDFPAAVQTRLWKTFFAVSFSLVMIVGLSIFAARSKAWLTFALFLATIMGCAAGWWFYIYPKFGG